MGKILFLLSLAQLFHFFVASPSMAWLAETAHVIDGDTVTVLTANREQIKIRLYGIDAPESSQPFGSKATIHLREVLGLGVVEVEGMGRDRYGRTVAILHLPDGRTANAEMIMAGLAWVYDAYCKAAICTEWRQYERRARETDAGLWADPGARPPWEWRRAKN